ncbi:MAG: gluconate 2-dehydrogenase subunit 3 family protein [Candidatus Tectomicrobia bacterium]|uniref:Gluconate 2-dehydrogenase subunit 3 family protein n=1 Tax=Tectimicrobiota bacterium TaxID=2528274 RepID=A0A937W2L8_UNCTE|nr:gluconate 2-dehydrogenase subunit 3 family protein [Candidatus Tectomicrobia bacterium]
MVETSATTPTFFTSAQRQVMDHVLNRIIPANGAFPGAGSLPVLDYIERVVAPSAPLKRLFTQGLQHLAVVSQRQYGQAFSDLAAEPQDTVLRAVETDRPGFFHALITHTYSGYYSHPTVLALLGMEVRPPQPRGYTLAPFDLSLLDHVKQRQPLYRSP